MKLRHTKTDKHVKLNLELDLAESYMHGKAYLENERYTINIQGGASGLVLPEILHSRLGSSDVSANFSTEKGNLIRIELPLKVGKDMIEVYDDALMLETGWKGDMPVSVEFVGVIESQN